MRRQSQLGRSSAPAKQRGVIATFIAIIVLIATLIAAAALSVSVNTSNTIAGNMAFRQGLVQESERAYGAVMSGFNFDVPADDSDRPAAGYFASIQPYAAASGIPTLLAGATPGGVALPPSATGNSVRYVIERLCTASGPASKPTCIVPLASSNGGSVSNQTGDQGNKNFQSRISVAYRLTVRVDGPRGSVGYMQTILR
jgi:hypothetical protein